MKMPKRYFLMLMDLPKPWGIAVVYVKMCVVVTCGKSRADF